MKARTTQNAYSSGELDPRLFARTDFQRFKTGLAQCRGFFPMRQGGFTRAPGTIWKGTTRNNAAARRIPFVFAADDAVELEFTEGVMRVWRYGALIMNGGAPYELATPYAEADLPNLDYAQDGDVIYLVDGRQPIQRLARAALDNWSIAPATLQRGPFAAENSDENRTIRAEILPDVDPIWQPDEPLTIGDRRRYGRNSYVFQGAANPASDPLADGPCGPRPPTHAAGSKEYTYQVAGADARASWAFAEAFANLGKVRLLGVGTDFDASDVGRQVLLQPVDFSDVPIWVGNSAARNGQLIIHDGKIYRHVAGADSGVQPPVHTAGVVMTDGDKGTKYLHVSDLLGIVQITTVTDANTVEGDILRAIPQPCVDDPTSRWSLSAWSDQNGYPAAIAVYQQRLFAAATHANPRTLWASGIGDFSDFLPGVEADQAFAYTLEGTGQKNSIVWLAQARRGLFVGSLGEVRRAFSSSDQDAIGPSTFNTEIASTEGVAAARPVAALGDPIYIARGGRRLNEVRFSFEDNGSRPLDLSLPSQHLGASPHAQIEWQSAPLRTAWLRRADGLLMAMIYDPDQEVLGWAPVSVAGGHVEDICISPDAAGGRDLVTVTVRRIINGETVRSVEQMADNETTALEGGAPTDWVHLFACQLYAGVATAELSAPHLAGETVSAWTDIGNFDGLKVAQNGAVTLPAAVTRAVVGLFDETHVAETLPISPTTRDGYARGSRQRLNSLGSIVLHNTAGGRMAAVERDFETPERINDPAELVPRALIVPADTLLSGIKHIDSRSGQAFDLRFRFWPQGGAPLTVLSVTANTEEVT